MTTSTPSGSPAPSTPPSGTPSRIERDELLSRIGSIRKSAENLHLLRESIRKKRIIPFVGAGLSVPFGYPGWTKFLREYAKTVEIEDKIARLCHAGEYEQAAEVLLDTGAVDFEDTVADEFGSRRIDGKALSGAVLALAGLQLPLIITTNFDPVLEHAFRQGGKPFDIVTTGASADTVRYVFEQDKNALIKIHGHAHEAKDRVFTRTDYDAVYGDLSDPSRVFDKPLPKLLLQLFLSNTSLLFLGCSLGADRTMTVLDRVSGANPSIRHYAIMEQPADIAEFGAFAKRLADQRIRVIWFPPGQFNCIELILDYLADPR